MDIRDIPSAGSIVTVHQKDMSMRGTVMPSMNEKTLILKLESGYNVGIDVENMTSIFLEKGPSLKKEERSAVKDSAQMINISDDKRRALPVISILHTGGTIASKVDYETGAVKAQYNPAEIVQMFPELTGIASIRSRLIANMSSDDMRFAHYNIIAKAIEEEIGRQAQGIILTQGTDTIHYTSAALAFLLQNIRIPVVIVGSQRSSDRGSSDAALNLIGAALFISEAIKKGLGEENKEGLAGVFICMHASSEDHACAILRGVNARKMHTSRRDAFRPINTGLVAQVIPTERPAERVRFCVPEDALVPHGKFIKHAFDEQLRIGIIKSHPQMYAAEFKAYDGFDGLVIEGTGLGHIPITASDAPTKEHALIKEAVRDLASRMPLVMSAQTIYGMIDMNVYSPGRELIEMGILGNYSTMTPETTFIKLAFALSRFAKEGNGRERIREFMKTNIIGELPGRIDQDSFLL